MSPELITPGQFGEGRPTKSSDCYALGMVIYETISGRLPFHEHADLVVFLKVMQGEHPTRGKKFSQSLWKMLESCWDFRPDARPAVEDVLPCLSVSSDSPEPPSRSDGEIETDWESSDSASIQNGTSARREAESNPPSPPGRIHERPRAQTEVINYVDEAYEPESVPFPRKHLERSATSPRQPTPSQDQQLRDQLAETTAELNRLKALLSTTPGKAANDESRGGQSGVRKRDHGAPSTVTGTETEVSGYVDEIYETESVPFPQKHLERPTVSGTLHGSSVPLFSFGQAR